MAVTIGELDTMIDRPDGPHLDATEVAAYLDGLVPGEVRSRIQQHLADCEDCRDEVLHLLRIAPRPAKRSRMHVWAAGAAAAAILVIAVWPRAPLPRDAHREAPIAATIAPRAIAPTGTVDGPPLLVWASVPGADRYVVRVFEASGDVAWQSEGRDTTVAVPDTIVRAGAPYFWKVEAHAGFGRSVSSELTEFVRRRAGP